MRILAPVTCLALAIALEPVGVSAASLVSGFRTPPPEARPWAYWFIMDGNLSREGITADLEAMQRAGLGGVIMMEVDVGIPRGSVGFMSEAWRELFRHAVREAERLGLEITLNSGPGWTGSGGPWVKPEQSMQHLVASETNVTGPIRFEARLPRPQPRKPFFGEGALPPALEKARKEFYRDTAVLAFPTPKSKYAIADIEEKALYVRAPYSSQPGVKPYLPAPAVHAALPAEQCIQKGAILDLTSQLSAEGNLAWDVPAGDWTILRFGRTTTGQNTRPAPQPGLGLECDKFDKAALEAHFAAFIEPLLRDLGPGRRPGAGWTMLHIDSWEMSAQNWTSKFREEFQGRRGYDPLPYLPVMTGRVVENLEISERFLWDLRQTAQELIVENHALHLKELGRRHGFGLSIEPYDMNPCADLSLGGAADVPMCEFWATGYGFATEFSCFEAVSIGHTLGRPIVAAESFTALDGERWLLHPGAMKAQGDWALCTGINRIVFHRYQHQPWLDRWPGMTMGSIGVHWERTQTWWDLAPAYHTYLARCQFLLRRGLPVADICYLAPEGAPHVFRPPKSATRGNPPTRRGYNFDGCAPETLLERMSVEDGRLVLPGGMTYRVLVLPDFDTMRPALLGKVKELVEAGATVVGAPPAKSPSLSGYPNCDAQVRQLADALWGGGEPPARLTERRVGKGCVVWGGEVGRQTRPASSGVGLLEKAKWIWHPEGNPASSAPPGRRYFQREVVLEAGHAVESARAVMTADNEFELWVNGESAGTGNNFHQACEMNVTGLLRPGTNLLAVLAQNGGDQPNPAGLIGCLVIQFGGGGQQVVATDGQWRSAAAPPVEGWKQVPASGVAWVLAMELGPLGMGPWNKPGDPAGAQDLYPAYELVARLLANRGVPADFEADAPLRYTHRHDSEADIYFVANPEDRPVAAHGVFCATGQPELWDALTGQQRPLPEFSEQGGRTSVPLRFEPHESFFVVFRQKQAPAPTGKNFPEYVRLTELTGSWEVRFQAKRGAPDRVTFETLADWSKATDPGVKYFSGSATYRKEFNLSPDLLARDRPLFLDLGKVQVMAGVTLNGTDLGVAWTTPFRLEASRACKPGRNVLEVRVANLWPNRLIGDAALPQEKRVTWTTWNPFTKNSPLLESGLLGPVTLLASDPPAVRPGYP